MWDFLRLTPIIISIVTTCVLDIYTFYLGIYLYFIEHAKDTEKKCPHCNRQFKPLEGTGTCMEYIAINNVIYSY